MYNFYLHAFYVPVQSGKQCVDMKPPPRKRKQTHPGPQVAPRKATGKPPPPQRVSQWRRPEQRRLLRALRSLDHRAELDISHLTKRVRTRSTSEVNEMNEEEL